jgi:PPK2 family polyphosphate:nucleotide phosphotransferase
MKIKIIDFPTHNKSWDKNEIMEKVKGIVEKIGELQYQMYAQNKYSLLIIFQGMDASGKDGLTKGLLNDCNPIGIKVHSFKKPTETEYAHDFLWRVHQNTPGKGEIQVFIRSHYEDILVPAVEKFIPEDIIEQRYQLINDFEKLIEHNNTKVLKFFLHVSKKVQEERLMERIEQKEKHWKHKDSDWDTREKFDEYLGVYEKIINKCNDIPWHIVPADTNWQKLYFVADIVLKTMKGLDLEWPELISEKFRR